jgi:hypothetical protein
MKIIGETHEKPHKRPRKPNSRDKPEILKAENQDVKNCKNSSAFSKTLPYISDNHAALQIHNFNTLGDRNEDDGAEQS